MNPFTEHTQQRGITYFTHGCFAMGIAWRLLDTAENERLSSGQTAGALSQAR